MYRRMDLNVSQNILEFLLQPQRQEVDGVRGSTFHVYGGQSYRKPHVDGSTEKGNLEDQD